MKAVIVVALVLMLCGIASAGTIGWDAFDYACGTLVYDVTIVSAAGDTVYAQEVAEVGLPTYELTGIALEWGEYIMRVTGIVHGASGETYTSNCEKRVCVGGVAATDCWYTHD